MLQEWPNSFGSIKNSFFSDSDHVLHFFKALGHKNNTATLNFLSKQNILWPRTSTFLTPSVGLCSHQIWEMFSPIFFSWDNSCKKQHCYVMTRLYEGLPLSPTAGITIFQNKTWETEILNIFQHSKSTLWSSKHILWHYFKIFY